MMCAQYLVLDYASKLLSNLSNCSAKMNFGRPVLEADKVIQFA